MKTRHLRICLLGLLTVALTSTMSIMPSHTLAQSLNTQRYSVPGGSIYGAMASISTSAQFQIPGASSLVNLSRIAQTISAPQYFVVQGVQHQGQWTYPYQVSPNRGNGILTMSVAINSANHSQLIAVGIPTGQTRQPFSSHPQFAARIPAGQTRQPFSSHPLAPSGCPSAPSPLSGVVAPQVVVGCYAGNHTVTQDTYWYDPAGIHVTEVWTQIASCDEWYSPDYVSCSGGSDSTYYYQPSGWAQSSHSFSWGYASGQTSAQATSYVHFHNPNFPACGNQATDIYYQPQQATAAPGNNTGGVNTWVSASPQCVALLHSVTFTQST